MTTVKSHARKTKKGQVRVKAHKRRYGLLRKIPQPSGVFKNFEKQSEIFYHPSGDVGIEIDTRWNPTEKRYEFFYGLIDLERDMYGAPEESKKGFKSAGDALEGANKQIKEAVAEMKKASETDMFVYADYLGGDEFLTRLRQKNLRTNNLTRKQIEAEFKKFKKGE